MATPPRLTQMALQTLGDFVILQCGFLAEPRFCTPQWRAKVKASCRKFQQLIVKIVPIALVDELTNFLLHCVREVFFDWRDKDCAPCELEVMQEFLTCVVHPKVRVIKPMICGIQCAYLFPHLRSDSETFKCLLGNTVRTLKNLKVLHEYLVDFQWMRLKNEYFPKHFHGLQEYSGPCNDEALLCLAGIAKNLKTLNISESHGEINNKSVETILKFKHLENLSISDTEISVHEGIPKLMEGIVKWKEEGHELKSLELSYVNKEVLKHLRTLPGLKLSLLRNDAYANPKPFDNAFHKSDVQRLKNLVNVELSATLADIIAVLKKCGNQLEYLYMVPNRLDMTRQSDLDQLLSIAQYCKSLHCLHIKTRMFNFPHRYSGTPHPGFTSVQCLKFFVRLEYFVTEVEEAERCYTDFVSFFLHHCVNVKKVSFSVDYCFHTKFSFLSALLSRGYLKEVEEVYWEQLCVCCKKRVSESDNVKVAKKLTKACPKLRIVGGLELDLHEVGYNSQMTVFVDKDLTCKNLYLCEDMKADGVKEEVRCFTFSGREIYSQTSQFEYEEDEDEEEEFNFEGNNDDDEWEDIEEEEVES